MSFSPLFMGTIYSFLLKYVGILGGKSNTTKRTEKHPNRIVPNHICFIKHYICKFNKNVTLTDSIRFF